MDGLLTGLLLTIIDIYIIFMFIRLFVTERERYDAVLGMVFRATDPVVVQLRGALPAQARTVAPLIAMGALLLVKGMLIRSIPAALQGFLDTLFQLYVLILIIVLAIREYYTNPIASFGQRLIRPVRAVAARLSPNITTVNFLSIGLLIVGHAALTLVLRELSGDGGGQVLSIKKALIDSLRIVVNLTGFFTFVIIVNALLSWVSPDPLNPLVQLLTLVSAPITDPVRRVVPPLGGVIDISPIIALIGLQFVNQILHNVLDML
ncbi:MAG: YggT family protein [Candidatus Tectimicrobiota bacterium]